MGQYYRIAFKNDGDNTIHTSKRIVDVKGNPERTLAKLTEHSYFGNYLMDSIANMLYKNKTRLAWVGGYADENEVLNATSNDVEYEKLWGDAAVYDTEFKYTKFKYKGKFLLNHDTGEYLSFDDYTRKSKITLNGWKGYELNPISILTAIGNGQGGGDYRGRNEDKVGCWVWDLLEIVTKKKIPKGYKRFNVSFKVDWITVEERKARKKAKEAAKK